MKRLHALALFCAMLCAGASARANDTAISGVGGSWQPLRGEHPNIQMVRETVRLDIYPESYIVHAHFTFRNRGAAVAVEMGFPESGNGVVTGKRNESFFENFSSHVDGEPAAVRRIADNRDNDGEDYRALWVKRVSFAARQTREVTVSYRAPVGFAILITNMRVVSYDFTGGNWQGKVERSQLVCNFHVPGAALACASLAYKPIVMQRSDKAFTTVWRDWEAQSKFRFTWLRTQPGWLAEDEVDRLLPGWNAAKILIDESGPVSLEFRQKATMDYMPAALVYNGEIYGMPMVLSYWLFSEAGSDRSKSPLGTTTWTQDGKASLHLGARTITWQESRTGFEDSVTGQHESSLPIEIGGSLFVPLRPVSEILGIDIYAKNHVLHHSFRNHKAPVLPSMPRKKPASAHTDGARQGVPR